ncbi:MAG: hypothetical protein ACI9XC_002519, partial [Gammaproteobacteria bacterium]
TNLPRPCNVRKPNEATKAKRRIGAPTAEAGG